jgi:glycerophosphoryl diester phosphodiesterase
VAAAARPRFLDHPGPIAFAHRGGTEAGPENTLRAFGAAVALGYRYLETDVHLTADGVVVAFHDDRLDRVTDATGRIAELAWSAVAEARVGGSEPVPLLTELLEVFPDVRFNIEPKSDAVVEPLAAILRRMGALDRVCLGSFDDARVRRLRRLVGPDVCVGAGTLTVGVARVASWTLPALARLMPAHCLQVPVRQGPVTIVDRRFVSAAHELGRHVHVWTVDDADEMHRLLDLGVDGIMTDRPSVLKAVLEQRGEWAS